MWTTMTSPVGPLRLVAADGALTGVDFLDRAPATLDPGGGPESASHQRFLERAAAAAGEQTDADPLLREAADQLTAYFDGRLEVFDLPVVASGTPFQQRVWERLRAIKYGTTATYGELAADLGMAGHGARAVGMANGRNPVPIVVPCHRVVGSGGALTGYGGGMARKRWLLAHEQSALF